MNTEVYRHKKTSGIYSVICNASIEKTGELAVVYRNEETGERWVRPSSEFNDGRFERVVRTKSAMDIEYLTMTGETRNFLSSALLELVNRIEACGASIELTRAACLASDLRHAIGDRWNEPSKTSLSIVTNELSEQKDNYAKNLEKIYSRDDTEASAAIATLAKNSD